MSGLGGELLEAGVNFHDLTEIFVDRPEKLYRDNCCHVNAAGSEIMAETIGAAVVASLAAGTP